MDSGNPCIQRVIEVAKKLKLNAETPAYKKDCWAHIKIETNKIAIYIKESLELSKIGRERELWEKHGWMMLAVSSRKLEQLTDDQLMEHLREAVRWHGKVQK
jgi:hypothetical protein